MKRSKLSVLRTELKQAVESRDMWQRRAGQLYGERHKALNELQSKKYSVGSLERELKITRENYERKMGEISLRLIGAETERDLFKNRLGKVLAGVTNIISTVVSEPQVAVVKQVAQDTYRPKDFAPF